jgi:hypothetical protein
MSTDTKTLALAYLDAVAKQQYDKLEALLAPDLKFRGPVTTRSSAADYIGGLKRLAAVHVGNKVKRVFADGDEVCVIYDFVTNTPAGALATIEWLKFEGGRIQSIDLYYDRLPWQPVLATLAEQTERTERTGRASA